MCQTDIVGTGRDEPLIDPVAAEVALVGNVLGIVKRDRRVGTGIDTGLATGAQIVVHDDNAVIALANRFLRTDIRTGGIVAMPAQVHLKTKFQFIINQPGAILFNGNQFDAVSRPIFLLAGHFTGLAAPAEVVIYVYFKFGHNLFLYIW